MATMRRAVALSLCLLGLIAAAHGPNPAGGAEEAQKPHALTGKVFEVAAGRLSGVADGAGLVTPVSLVLLGEVHDNPAHHQVRARLIAEALRAHPEWRPAVVFEQIDTDQQPALDQFKDRVETGDGSATADELLRLLAWDKSGWPAAALYQPLFEAVIAAKLPIVAGSPPRDRVRAVARGGISKIAPEERTRLRLADAMPTPLAEALNRELLDSHCGALPPQAMGGMAAAQRYRDAHLADALLSAAQRQRSAILIAGNGHVRTDRGVPWHIRERAPGSAALSVLLLEVSEDETEPAAYLPLDPEGKPAADLAIFTARAERGDPCQSLLNMKR
jgi:uncharacterized iron-regulated protein